MSAGTGAAAPFVAQGVDEGAVSRTLRGGEKGPVDDLALGVAAADAEGLEPHRKNGVDRPSPVVLRIGDHAVDETPADLGRDQTVVARALPLVGVQGPPEPDEIVRFRRPRGGQSAVQIVKGEHVILDMVHPGPRHRPPAIADVRPGQFEPPEERSRVDSIERHVVGESLGRRSGRNRPERP